MPARFIPKELSEWKDELLLSMSQSNSSCIAIFNTDGTLIFANEAMNALFVGDPSSSIINPSFEKLTTFISSNGEPLFSGYITIGNTDGISSSIIAQVYRKSNQLLIVGGVNAKNLLEQNEAMLLLNRQVNNLQRQLIKEKHGLEVTLKKLNLANEKLEVLNATKDKFFSIIAHDLRNPFGSVLALSSLLAKKLNTYPMNRLEVFVQNMFLASKQAYNLLENLLEWSRVQTGKITPMPINFSINQAVQEVYNLLSPMANEKDVNLRIDSNAQVSVFADKEMIKAVFRNLLTNAIKFTKPGGEVAISVHPNTDNVICKVADNGVGIDGDTVENLFRIDRMTSEAGTFDEPGTGLGLILCKDFVDMNSGEIWVESTLNQGSTFSFTVPVSKD
ncbi:MAG: sensor histidine kinase [Bacteroidales bacterium]